VLQHCLLYKLFEVKAIFCVFFCIQNVSGIKIPNSNASSRNIKLGKTTEKRSPLSWVF
jgi:hypothetical protein